MNNFNASLSKFKAGIWTGLGALAGAHTLQEAKNKARLLKELKESNAERMQSDIDAQTARASMEGLQEDYSKLSSSSTELKQQYLDLAKKESAQTLENSKKVVEKFEFEKDFTKVGEDVIDTKNTVETLINSSTNANPTPLEKPTDVGTLLANAQDKMESLMSQTEVIVSKYTGPMSKQIQEWISKGNGSGTSSNSLVDSTINSINSINSPILEESNLLEIWAFTNIAGSIFILLCVLTIINLYFGDKFIQKYELTKYPLLSKLLKYRSIIKNYSIGLNLLFIVLMLILLITFNLLVFIL